ncbi:hypothetical protein [Jannaschia rubra]|uniref:Uncharacterized protein n=1 Tax=Jannaschia rubra TaxID=282197 RepID=A0A0M6XM73_9RHOB|nr:hypothetical protein [Jannaschia rubra]CTQ32246.1 hypothetical protein JAN5088_01009 [Jannaschia rubra]SFG49239.1 hypothetical protein SAMN04488517_105194 [Jannaschia rubra]
MASKRGPIQKLVDKVADRLSDLLGALTPEPDVIPIPVRNDRPRRPEH